MGNKLTYPEADLSGKVALITGGNTGIGYETAKGLARLGAHTFIACRSKERAEAAIEKIKRELSQLEGESSAAAKPDPDEENKDGAKDAKDSQTTGQSEAQQDSAEGEEKSKEAEGQSEPEEVVKSKESAEQKDGEKKKSKKEVKIEYLPLDLASFSSIKKCARLFKDRNLHLHILVNNAALLGPTFFQTDDGLEGQFQINHLGPVLLTLELLPVLLDTAASSKDVRILLVSSRGHFQAEPFSLELLNKTEANYKRLRDYSNTKLFSVMSGYCLQRRLQEKSITVSSIHPGYVRTEIDRSFSDMKVLMAVHKVASSVVARNPVEGAATSLNCAVNPELNSQQHYYYDSCRPKTSSADSRNEVFQEQLWEKTFEFLKDHLSPETYEMYGPKPKEESAQQAAGEESAQPAAAEESQEPAKSDETEETAKTSGNEGPVKSSTEENADVAKPEVVEETKSSTEGNNEPPTSSSEGKEDPAESTESNDSAASPTEGNVETTKPEQ